MATSTLRRPREHGDLDLVVRSVDCVAAEWAIQFHDAYPGDADDIADVRALCERFRIPIPEQYP